MTWEADVELERAYLEKLADSEKHGYAYRTPARGTIGMSVGDEPLYSGPESTLSLARRHYAQVDDPPTRPTHTWTQFDLYRMGLVRRRVL